MIFSPNRPCGRNSRKHQRQHIRKPDLDAAAHRTGRGRHFGKLLADADDQATDDGAGHRRQAAQDDERAGPSAQGHRGQRELHAELAEPQMIPATSAVTKPATHQTITQMRFSGMPMDCAAW